MAKAPWDEAELLSAVRAFVLPKIEKYAPIRAWIIDDTGIPKKGKHSVGVARQYCGELGKQDNCQVAVTLSVASDLASLPVALRLYLPEPWANDKARRAKAGIPNGIEFQTKPRIALDQIRQAIADGVRRVSRWPMPATAMTRRSATGSLNSALNTSSACRAQ